MYTIEAKVLIERCRMRSYEIYILYWAVEDLIDNKSRTKLESIYLKDAVTYIFRYLTNRDCEELESAQMSLKSLVEDTIRESDGHTDDV